MPHSAIKFRTRHQAQSLRRRPTDAERKLWYVLRSMKPLGLHFRRQAPIGTFIVDFVWYAGKLIVEIDGSQHAELQHDYDERRTAWLQSQGYRVLRYWNNEVLRTPRTVGEAILAAARHVAPPLPTPIPSPSQVGLARLAQYLARLAQYDAEPGQARVPWGGEESAAPPSQPSQRTTVGDRQ